MTACTVVLVGLLCCLEAGSGLGASFSYNFNPDGLLQELNSTSHQQHRRWVVWDERGRYGATTRISVTTCGAVADGLTNNHDAIMRCVRRAAASHVRTVYFPAGIWRTTPLFLDQPYTDGLKIEIDSGATLAAAGDHSSWPIQRLPCIYAPFVHISGGTNLVITGTGTIDGRGRSWWNRFYANRTFATVCDRPFLLVIDSVTNLTVHGVTLLDSPSETFILNNVSGAEVAHINVTARFYSTEPSRCVGGYDFRRGCEPPNTDGIDPAGGSSNIWIHDVTIENGDDGVAVRRFAYVPSNFKIKPSDAGEPCTRDVVVENVRMRNGYGAAVGSVSTGCIERVSFRNLTIDSPGCGCWIKLTNGSDPNAFVRDISWTDIWVNGQSDTDQCGVVSISALYEESMYIGQFVPHVSNISFRKIQAQQSALAGSFWCRSWQPCDLVLLEDIRINSSRGFNCSCPPGGTRCGRQGGGAVFGRSRNVSPPTCLSNQLAKAEH